MAAQLLSGQGFKEVYSLKGGINAWQGVKAFGPVELNLEMIRGDETPEEMITLAYGMEEALCRFYGHFGDQPSGSGLQDLFRTLAGVEEQHQLRLRETYARLRPSPGQVEEMTAAASARILEGGFKFEEFLRENEPRLKTEREVLELALMLETQALDLYLRFALKVGAGDTQEILHRLGDEEKAHLAALSRRLDGKSPSPKND